MDRVVDAGVGEFRRIETGQERSPRARLLGGSGHGRFIRRIGWRGTQAGDWISPDALKT